MTATTANPAEQLQSLVAEQLARNDWSRQRLLAHQNERLCQLLAHAVVRSPYYLETLGPDAAGRPLETLPTLSKAALMEQWDRIACDRRLHRDEVAAHAASQRAAEPYLGDYHVFTTSGASGLRGLFVYSAAEWAAVIAVSLRAMVMAGARPGERTIGIGAPPGVHMSERLYAALRTRTDTPRISALTPLEEMVDALNAFQPEILLGYPTIGALLAAEQLAGRLRIAPRLIAFGSEPVTLEARERVQQAWGLDPGEYYTSTEAAVIASSTPEHPRAPEIYEDQYIVEIVDEDNRPVPPGTAGAKVLLTNLQNRTLPLIRYEIADRVTVSPEPNPAGRPYRQIAAIDGRTADTLTFPARAGGTVSVLPLRLGGLFTRMSAVRQFQIVHEAGALEIRVVLDAGAPADTAERVRGAVIEALEEAGAVPPPVSVTPVAELEREPGGGAKLKLIVSR